MDYISNVDETVVIEKAETGKGGDALKAYGNQIADVMRDKKKASEKQSIRDRLK